MTYETSHAFFGSGDGDTPGRFHISLRTNGTSVKGVATADNADKAVHAAKAHIADMFCTLESIVKLPDGIDIAAPGPNSPTVNFIIDETKPLEARLDADLKLLCKKWTDANMCEPDECENCPINQTLEMLEVETD